MKKWIVKFCVTRKKSQWQMSVPRHKSSGILPGCGIAIADLETRCVFDFTLGKLDSCTAA